MTWIKFSLLGFLLFATSSLSQKEKLDSLLPTWYIEVPTIYAMVLNNGTRMGATFDLFRSGRRILTTWNIYNHISCSHTLDSPDTSLKNGWMGCQENLDAPEGEKSLSPDVYERLKWRVIDLKVDNVTSKFETVTIQVVNALPASV
jgi:hypothetical protein